jgi:hypothetical protein
MGLSPGTLLKGIVSRVLSAPRVDGPESEAYARFKKYGDLGVENVWPTDHGQADEGSLFVASTLPGATALQLGISASWSATAAAILVYNSDQPIGNGGTGKNVLLKRLRLNQSVAPTSGVDLRMSVWTDPANRQPTTISNAVGSNPPQGPGTPATATAYRSPANSPNSAINVAAVGVPYFPLSTAGGAAVAIPNPGPNARCIIGQQYIKSSIPVVKDEYIVQFGMADAGGAYQGAAALARGVISAEPVIIGPGHWGIIYLWSASNITAGNAWDDVSLSWCER